MARTPWWNRKGHGTEARCRRHYREGDKPCQACREAANEAHNRREEKRRGK